MEELQVVTNGCLKGLSELQQQLPQNHLNVAITKIILRYMAYLVTATLCLGLAPRSQILKELRINTSFVKEKEKYWVQLPAERSKNRKPVLLALPDILTPHYDFYLQKLRPSYLDHCSKRYSDLEANRFTHQYVFFKRSGEGPRDEFASLTRQVTLHLIGRSVNAHEFRAALITNYYESGATQAQMDTLATLMAHDSNTAKQYYYRPKLAQAAVNTNEAMMRVVLAGGGPNHWAPLETM